MKKFLSAISAMLVLSSCSNVSATEIRSCQVSPKPSDISVKNTLSAEYVYNTNQPINYSQQKAVWVSYIDLSEMLTGKSQSEFEKSFSAVCKNIKNLGCNTIYVHVRAFSDAYYSSELFPWSKGVTGSFGVEPDFDPLEIMIEKAHEQSLSFHAWINPFRCETDENMKLTGENFTIGKWYANQEDYPEYLTFSKSDNHWWLNPAVEEVRNFVADGVEEIVSNYQVDGIHFDDYFYPYSADDFDLLTYEQSGSDLAVEEWRIENCNEFIKQIYERVKSVDPNILFGVSPQGNIENNYEYMYADVKEWCSKSGYIDYIVPQIYFGYENNVKPFLETAEEWGSIVTDESVSLIIGLAPYKISEDGEFSQNVGIISEQIADSMKLVNCSGTALYSYRNLFEDKENYDRLEMEKEKIRAVFSTF